MFASFVPIPALRRLVAVLLCSAPTSLALAGNVHTVGGTGSTYADIQSAVDAAAAGDTILVRSGSYPGFAIDNRSLAIVADTGAAVDVISGVSIRNFEAGRKVVLAGLRLYGFHLAGNAGSVRVQSCVIWEAVLDASDDVAFVGCTLRGGWGGNGSPGGDGGMGLRVSAAGKVALYDCNLLGGQGGYGLDSFDRGGRGGCGCYLDNGAFLFASGTTIQGGNGGQGADNWDCYDGFTPGDGGDGGDGIRSPGGVHVVLQDSPAYPGIGGAGGLGCGSWPPDGQPGVNGVSISLGGGSTLEEPPVWARRLVMPTPVRELSPIHLTLTGQPGELVYLTMWGNTRFLYSPGYNGVLLEGAPLIRRVRLGVVPASGVLDKDITLPDLGPGVQARTYYFQAYFLDGSGVATLSSPAFGVTLDSSF